MILKKAVKFGFIKKLPFVLCLFVLGSLNVGAQDSEDDKFWARANGQISQPCLAEEMIPDTACGEARVLSQEKFQVLENKLQQHRSQGLFGLTGRFSFYVVIRPEKSEASTAPVAEVPVASDSSSVSESQSKESKLIRYLGTCRGVGTAQDNSILLLSVSKFGVDGKLVKQYGYAPGGIDPLRPPVLGTLEARALRKLCEELRTGVRPSPEIVY